MEKLSLHKAQLKMLISFLENSTDRSTIKKYYSRLKSVEGNLLKTATKIDRLTLKLQKNRNMKTNVVSRSVEDGSSEKASPQSIVSKKSFCCCCSCTKSGEKYAVGQSAQNNSSSQESTTRSRAVDAFIVFEYNESFARCIEDYSRFGHFPYSLCFPSKLKFKGRALKVSKAPEPEQINWENLEVSTHFSIFLSVHQ